MWSCGVGAIGSVGIGAVGVGAVPLDVLVMEVSEMELLVMELMVMELSLMELSGVGVAIGFIGAFTSWGTVRVEAGGVGWCRVGTWYYRIVAVVIAFQIILESRYSKVAIY